MLRVLPAGRLPEPTIFVRGSVLMRATSKQDVQNGTRINGKSLKKSVLKRALFTCARGCRQASSKHAKPLARGTVTTPLAKGAGQDGGHVAKLRILLNAKVVVWRSVETRGCARSTVLRPAMGVHEYR